MAVPADSNIQEAGPSYSLTQDIDEADPASAAQALDANSEYVHVKVHSDRHKLIFTGNKQIKYETVKKERAEGQDRGGRKQWTYQEKKQHTTPTNWVSFDRTCFCLNCCGFSCLSSSIIYDFVF